MAQPQHSPCKQLGERDIQGIPVCRADAHSIIAPRRLVASHKLSMCGEDIRSLLERWHMYVLHHLQGDLKSLMPCTLAQALLHPDRRVAV